MRKLLIALTLPILVLVASLIPTTSAAMLMIGPNQVDSGGVRIGFSPDPALPRLGDVTKLSFTVQNITGPTGPRVVKHVDIVVSITLGGRPVLEAITHSHTGTLIVSQVFNAPGIYRIAFDASSTPDSVNPAMGGTPGDDFGSRTATFWIAVIGNPQSVTVNSVTIEFDSPAATPGAESNLIFRVKNATTGDAVMHVDLSLTVSDGSRNVLATSQLHGHLGIMGVSTIFSHSGTYTLSVTASTTPATPLNDRFGSRSASFTVSVQQSGADNNLLLVGSYVAVSLAGAGAAALALTYIPRFRNRPRAQ